jgi:signal transduction histidine kinase
MDSAATRIDEPARGPLDHYARLVRRAVGVPVAVVSLREPDPLCRYVVRGGPLVVTDARRDPRLTRRDVEDLGVVACAGWPLRDVGGRAVGVLYAVDHAPRAWTRDEVDLLEVLAAACSADLYGPSRAPRVSADVAAVSHDLRTPLTSVLGYLELVTDELRDELDDDQGFVAGALETMRRNGVDLERRIEDVLELLAGLRSPRST